MGSTWQVGTRLQMTPSCHHLLTLSAVDEGDWRLPSRCRACWAKQTGQMPHCHCHYPTPGGACTGEWPQGHFPWGPELLGGL